MNAFFSSFVTNFLERCGYIKLNRTYQDNRFPQDQYEIIRRVPEYGMIRNSLEIGCNRGLLTQMVAKDGKFAIGIDLKPYWRGHDTESAILGVYPLSQSEISNIPEVDCIFLLSVHHQWVSNDGDGATRDVIKELFSKARICMFIEFASLAKKYGYEENSEFTDNDESQVISYANAWLDKEFELANFEHLGRTRELLSVEPYRQLYIIRKNSIPGELLV